MFKFLKDKLKKSVSIFSKKVEEEGDEQIIEEEKEILPEEIKEEKTKEIEKPTEVIDTQEKTELVEEAAKEEPKEERVEVPEEETKPIEKEETKDKEDAEKVEEKIEVHSEEEKPAKKEEVIEEIIPEKTEEKEEKPIEDLSDKESDKEEKTPEKIHIEKPEELTKEKRDEKIEELEKELKPKKQGFFGKLFGKKEKVEEEKTKEEKLPEEVKEEKVKESEKKEEIKETPKEISEKISEGLSDKKEPEETKPIEEEIKKREEIKPEKTEEEIAPIEKTPAPEEDSEPEQKKEIDKEIPKEEPKIESTPEKIKEEKPVKKGFFQKITEKVVTKKINLNKFEEIFWDMELALLENNVAVEVIHKIKSDMIETIVDIPIKRNKIEETILSTLKESIDDVLSSEKFDILKNMENKKPYVIAFIGINGSGKTTTIAKVAKMLLDKNKKVVLAAADTFRAAAIDQLKVHADNLGIKIIKHDYGSDPAAVAFDAVKYAESKNMDVVLIDTAGRLHSNTNLIDEMKKIIRVAKPDLKIFVGEAITGNDCIEQATKFNEAVEIDGIILSKADIDEKGGASISVSYVTKKPILYLGTGQEYKDLKEFDKDELIQSLGLEV